MLRLRPMDALATGGDDRLTLDKTTLLNKYYASTFPRAGVIRRGSCTCSTVTYSDYAYVCYELDRLTTRVGTGTSTRGDCNILQQHLDSEFTGIRNRLAAFFGLAATGSYQSPAAISVGGSINYRPAEIVLFPSGSDAELLASTAALVRSFKLAAAVGEGVSKVSVLNCVVAGGEVGSGTANAAQGKHFSVVSPTLSGVGSSGKQQTVGELVDGIAPESIEVRVFDIRDAETGVLRSIKELEAAVTDTILTELSANPLRVCLLHLVCSSKTGVVVPSLEFAINMVTSLKARDNQDERLLVVVDCCQLRCHPEYVHRAATSGFICLVTGSKYYCGPPFSGAVLLPRALADEMEAHVLATGCKDYLDTCMVPAGLCHYLTGVEIPATMPHLRTYISRNWARTPAFPTQKSNIGLWLRWSCALRTMELHSRITTTDIDGFAALWVNEVKRLITEEAHPYLQLVSTEAAANEELSTSLFYPQLSATLHIGGSGVNTIISVAVCVRKKVQSVNKNHSIAINQETSESIEFEHLGLEQCRVFHQIMSTIGHNGTVAMIGQPVKLHSGNSKKVYASKGAHSSNDIPSCVLRFALGADMVVAGFSAADAIGAHTESLRIIAAVDSVLGADAAVVRAMRGLAENWPIAATAPCKSIEWDTSSFGGLNAIIPITTVDSSHFVQAVKTLATSGDLPDVALLYNLDVLDHASDNLMHAFNGGAMDRNTYLHCFAVKSCPLTYILQHCVSHIGLGLETASLMEVKQALRCGAPPKNVVYDSPCKSLADIRFAITAGVNINANSWCEFDKILGVLNEIEIERRGSSSSTRVITGDPGAGSIGLRVNPLVGRGIIPELSTATATSKFGIPLTIDGSVDVVTAVVTHRCVRSLMCHVGSQGMSVQVMASGVATLCLLADKIDAACSAAGELWAAKDESGGRIHTVDIGGGLSANYTSDAITPTFEFYVTAILRVYPRFFAQGRRVITEFGKSLIAKAGVIANAVEDVLPLPPSTSNEQRCIAVTHAGADLMLRTAYCPGKFAHRFLHLPASDLEVAVSFSGESEHTPCLVTIAGPLCFSGDILVTEMPVMRRPVPKDRFLALDAGANTLSLFSRHCSRPAPAVYVFRQFKEENAKAVGRGGSKDHMIVTCIKAQETEDDLFRFWG